METSQGFNWIKLHREIRKWEWYKDSYTKSLFLELLLMASYKPQKYKGVTIESGCLITGRQKLAEDTGLSVQNVRTCLERLKSTNEITIKTTPQGTHIQIVKYADYQMVTNDLTSKQPATNQQLTSKQPATNQQLTTINKVKNDKNEKNEKKEKKETHIQAFRLEGENFNFNTIENQILEQELDVKLFWGRLLKIYNPEGDKSIHNTALKKQREKIIGNFSSEEREKILEWFGKYKNQLEILSPWIGNFFKDHKTIESIAEYFRSIKDVKESDKKKYKTREELRRWTGHSAEDY